MYMLFKNKRPIGNVKFTSYEKCRQWARKLARKQPVVLGADVEIGGGFYKGVPVDRSRWYYRTPTLADYGYSVRKV